MSTTRIAARCTRMGTEAAFRVFARAKELEAQGRDIVHMEIGEPDFPTPAPVLAAAQQALSTGNIHYTPATGLPMLREAIANYYQQRYGVLLNPARIVVTPGASGALLLALGVLLDPDKQLMLADPGYPCNRNFAHFLHGRVQSVAVNENNTYQLTADLIEQNWQADTTAVLLASPSNPTGTIVPGEDLARICSVVHERGGTLLVDEIYHGLIYEGAAPSALQYSDDVFVINSFSKYFCMTGWRLGWLVVPEAYISEVDKLAQNIFLAAPTLSQYAALAAFSPENIQILEQQRELFKARRDFLLPALRKLGFSIPVTPAGAFYLYAGCERFTNDSYQFAYQLLEEVGVAVTPGLDFGNNAAASHLRFAYTTSLPRLQEGIERLHDFLAVSR